MAIPGDHIQTIETKFSQAIDSMFDTPHARAVAPQNHLWPAYLYPSESKRGYYIPPQGTDPTTTIQAVANNGRWITACPYCPSAQHASRDDHHFYCAVCQNEANGNRSVLVSWPDDVVAVDEVLLERPFRENRNWLPEETVLDLVAENVANGLVAE